MPIKAFAALEAKSRLQAFEVPVTPLGEQDVLVTISHCGLCHSDIHLIDNDWQVSSYPLVPGHEVIGTVSKRGAGVQHLQLGQRVGIGWQRSACLTCEYCIRGDENLCTAQQATCVGHFGGFASAIQIDGRFAFPIPEALRSEQAAPLLCGGITVYAPLRTYGITPNMKIGVIGIGGLGHLALQFARAFGCDVTAFSSTPDKEAEAIHFGAHHFVSSTDKDKMQSLANHFGPRLRRRPPQNGIDFLRISQAS
jgi:uncharacterized zinc-type alcohol dehydrogenase-like protein